jgi:hypothetical protein
MVQVSVAIAIILIIGVLAGVGVGASSILLAGQSNTTIKTVTQDQTLPIFQTQTQVNLLPTTSTVTEMRTFLTTDTTTVYEAAATPYGLSLLNVSIVVTDPIHAIGVWTVDVENTANSSMTDLFAYVGTGSGFVLMYFPSRFNSSFTEPGQSISNSTYVTGVSEGSTYLVEIFGYWSPACLSCSSYVDLSLHVTAS